jgi:hypothetical protein
MACAAWIVFAPLDGPLLLDAFTATRAMRGGDATPVR